MTTNDALALVRVSTGSQDESTQVTALNNHAEANGIKIVHTDDPARLQRQPRRPGAGATRGNRGHRATPLALDHGDGFVTAGPP